MREFHFSLYQMEIVGQHGLRFPVLGVLGKLPHQRSGHTKHRIAGEVFIAIGENLGDQDLVPGRRDHEVQVRRAIGMAQLRPQQIPAGAVRGNGVARRPYCFEKVGALCIGGETTS